MTNDGDIFIQSDIIKTMPIPLRDVFQKIRKAIESNGTQWKFYRGGAKLNKFLGFPNTKELGLSIQNTVRNTIINENIVSSDKLNVIVYPNSANEITIKIIITYGSSTYVQNMNFSLKA